MRPAFAHGLTLLALVAAAPVAAGPIAESPWVPFQAALARQCPAKRLDLLAPAELRDALDSYRTGRPPRERRAMAAAERRRCARVTMGASCANAGDLDVAVARRTLPALAAAVCDRFARCREQSDCDAMPSPAVRR